MNRLSGLVVLALLIESSLAGAQGGAEDYERSRGYYERFSGLTVGESFRGDWLSPDHLVFRKPRTKEEWTFVFVDAERGAVEEAFDHERVAHQLGAARDGDFDPARLPLRILACDASGVTLLLDEEEVAFRVDRDGENLVEVAPDAIPGAAAEDSSSTERDQRGRSRSSTRRRRSESPDGRLRVLESDRSLVLRDEETGSEQTFEVSKLKDDERYERITYSPDGSRVVALRVREGEEHTVHLIESSPEKQKQPKLHSFSYLKPGDRIDHKRIVLLDPSTLTEIAVDHALFDNPWSIKWLEFSPDGTEVWFLYNQRGHQVLRFLAVDARSGAVRTLVEDTPETFVDYSSKHYLKRLDDRGELLWTSERSGWNHLYSVTTATGEVRALTSGEWVLREVERVDEEDGVVWIRAVGVYADQDPYHVHYGRVALDGSGVTWLTEGDGTHRLQWGPEREFYVDTWSRVDQPPVHELRRAADGSLVAELFRADITRLKEAGWRAPERFVAKGRDGETDIWGVIHVPTNFDPTKSYPVIESIYAGPQNHYVPKKFRRAYGVMEIAELGFVVVQVDGMGTNWRSKAFHDVCWQNLGDSGFPDRILWIRAAAKDRPWMDLERVGIYGGSAGGQSSTRALLAHGDFYHVAVSDCGCHDNTMDKIWWNEQWMGWPIGEHYKEQSNVTQAHKLEGELLLIVGELDRNVDPASTMQVVDALIRADKDFDMLVIPGAGHGSADTTYGKRRRKDFFVEHLMGVEPRWE